MAKSIPASKKFPGICSRTSMEDYSCKFGLPRRTRCAHCLKFRAEDPSKIGDDEFGKLLRCSICKKVNYCSKVCAEKHYPYHKRQCNDLIVGNKFLVICNCGRNPCVGGESKRRFNVDDIMSYTPEYYHRTLMVSLDQMKQAFLMLYMHSSTMYETAIMGQDRKLCEEYLDFAAKMSKFMNLFEKTCGDDTVTGAAMHGCCNQSIKLNIDIHCNVMLLCLGRDQEAYEFLKYSAERFGLKAANYEHFKNMPKNSSNSCREKFFAMDFFKGLMYATKNDLLSGKYMSVVAYWLILAVIKINVIEEMEHNLAKMKDFIERKDSRKKFWNGNKWQKESTVRQRLSISPKVWEGLAIMFLGNDEDSFISELNAQKEQLKKLLTYMLNSFPRKELYGIWLCIEGDCREHFIKNCENEEAYKKFLATPFFALVKYFDIHPTVSKIILEFMEKKKIKKVEKNSYVNLMELPRKGHYLDSFVKFC